MTDAPTDALYAGLSRQIVERATRAQGEAAAPSHNAWVTASAGSGKTTVLTDRVLTLLLAGAPATAILCLTFTKAAAAEMANRVNRRLGGWAIADDEALDGDLATLLGRAPNDGERLTARRLFARVLDAPGGLKIMTIHAFCQSVLRRFPLEAGVAPHFEVMTERDSVEMLDEVIAEIMAQAPDGDGPARGGSDDGDRDLGWAIAETTGRLHETGFAELLRQIVGARSRLLRLIARHGDLRSLIAHSYQVLGVEPGQSTEALIAEACLERSFSRGDLARAAAALAAGGSDSDQTKSQIIDAWLQNPGGRERMLSEYANVFLKDDLTARAASRLCTKKAADTLPDLRRILTDEQRRLATLFERVRATEVAAATEAALILGADIVSTYQLRKAARAQKDYEDLIIDTQRLLDQDLASAWVLYKLDGGIDHILIDEAQDTNAAQWDVVRMLAEEFFAGLGAGDDERAVPRTVFAVGDVKQSIYSFQQAEPKLFDAYRRHFAARATDAGRDWHDVTLDVSFRSTDAVLMAVDGVFAQPQARDGVVADGAELVHLAARSAAAGSVEIWDPVKPQAQDPPKAWKPPVEGYADANPRSRLARLLALRIRRWLDDGDTLPSKNRPIAPGDIMILVRRRDALVDEVVRELKRLDVPVAGVDRMVLTEQLAIEDLMALGRFVLLPEDDLTLACVLKGPLIGIGEEQLFELAYDRDGTLWQSLCRCAERDDRFRPAQSYLEGLRARADFQPPYEFYATLLAEGGRARMIARLGADAEDPINEFLSLAMDYEAINVPSLQGFLHWLEVGKTDVKRDLDRSAGAVRVMTVHGAKGLEAPIVILPDTCRMPSPAANLFWRDEAMIWAPAAPERDPVSRAAAEDAKQAMREEYHRLLYVAMTRAEDRLIVCGWHGQRRPDADSWYELIANGLDAMTEKIVDPFLAGFPDTIDPTVRRIVTEQRSAVDAPPDMAAPEPPPLPPWATVPPAPEPTPPRPLAPSQPLYEEPATASPLAGEPGDGARSEGLRRGRLIHGLLQHLPELGPADRAEAAQRALAALAADMAADERRQLIDEVLAVIDDPDIAPIFGPASKAEVPVTGRIDLAGAPGEGRRPFIVSGQVDRLVIEPDRVLIVDYKSNRPPPETATEVPAAYVDQMAAYRALLSQLFADRRIDCALLWTVGPRWMPLDPELLDRSPAAGASGRRD